MLPEVEQTVDDVVIIANGRLVAQGAMADLHGDAQGDRPHVRPRAPSPARCGSPTSERTVEDGALLADTHDLRLVGDVALRAGLPIHELRQPDRPRGAVLRAHRGHQPQPRRGVLPQAARAGCRRRARRGQRMTAAIRAEFRKFFTTRMWWGMAIAIFVAGAAFAVLFGFLLHQRAVERGPGQGVPTGDAAQIANSVYTGGPQRRLPADAGHRRDADRLGVPAPDDHRHLPRHPRRATVMVAKVIALLVIGALYGLLSLVGSVAAGADRARRPGATTPFPHVGGLPHAGAALLVLGPVGAHRPRRRHPHPQPGGRAAHLDRRGVDRRAARWASALSFSELGREHIVALPARAGHQRDGQRGDARAADNQSAARLVGRRARAGRVCRGAGRARLVADGAPRHQLSGVSAHPDGGI